MQPKPIARIIERIDPDAQQLIGIDIEEAKRRLLANDPEAVCQIGGSFALVAREGERVCLARSLDRPLRYFLAKEVDGPLLVVADRIDSLCQALEAQGYGAQFHPSYTRMVPAHHVVTLRLVGCPDPNPRYQRFFAPARATATSDLDEHGRAYVGALLAEVDRWLDAVAPDEPLGMLFSGGIDSGAVLLAVVHRLLAKGASPSRLKAFTLSVGAGSPGGGFKGGPDLAQARDFLRRTDLAMLGEAIEVAPEAVDPLEAVRVIEDYKPLDVECAAVALALCRGIRARYPKWRLLIDGDGGDENLKDYPIEANHELTIRSVVSNSMLYQEGWGVDALKHSLTYSGGQSRGCVRSWAPLRRYGFAGFSPLTRPRVIEAAEAIPFATLTRGDHQKLYALKGEIVRRGMRAHLGVDMPIYPKRRFQHGATAEDIAATRFAGNERHYREHFFSLYP